MKYPFRIRTSTFLAMIAFGALASAGLPNAPTLAAAENEAIVAEYDVQELWRANCSACHGRDGKGQTRAGRRAGVKDLTDPKHQASFSDDRAFKHIRKGMVENGNELMKPFGKGLSEDNGLTDGEILALVRFLRQFDPDWREE